MIRIVALTEAGSRLGERLCRMLPGSELWSKPDPFKAKVQQAFRDGESLVMICATGIVVRTLAEVIDNKHEDPPVVVLDEVGEFVVPLLSGHEGGANELASQIAARLDAQLVITTANPYLRPVYTIGMGCERNCSVTELDELLRQCLDRAGLDIGRVASINSIDIKSDEVGLIALGKQLGLPFQVFDANQLNTVVELLSTRSDYVFDTVGVYGVAESAALFAAAETTGTDPELVIEKIKTTRATCALARAYPLLEQ